MLDHVARIFEVGVRYPEGEVNAMLRVFHPDYAALRRHLVDEDSSGGTGELTGERAAMWRCEAAIFRAAEMQG